MPVPDSMRAVRQVGIGDLDQLEVVRMAVPRPGRGEVLVRVMACGLNNSDVMRRTGGYGSEEDPGASTGWKREAPALPRILGSDVAGVVAAVGNGVDPGRIGSKVLVNPTLYNRHPEDPTDVDYLGSERDGGYAEFCTVPQTNVHEVRTGIAFEDLATFPVSYLTALHMLNRARVTANETIVVTGASGGVGSALLQLAEMMRLRSLAIVGRGKEERALSLGAAAAVPRDADSLDEAILEASGGTQVDVVADVAGGSAFSSLLRALRPGGRYVTCGAIAGPIVRLDLRTVYLKHLELVGSSFGTAAEFRFLVDAIDAGRLVPLRAATYPLEAAAEAQRAFVEKRHFGNIVLDCS